VEKRTLSVKADASLGVLFGIPSEIPLVLQNGILGPWFVCLRDEGEAREFGGCSEAG
jgi:hypothetical protein